MNMENENFCSEELTFFDMVRRSSERTDLKSLYESTENL